MAKKDNVIKVLLIFNKLSSYKKIIYESFLEVLGDKAKVELQIHNYDVGIFRKIIADNKGRYHYYGIMPHFKVATDKEEYLDVLKKIPLNQLLLLDKRLPELTGQYIGVFQDFGKDIHNALTSCFGVS